MNRFTFPSPHLRLSLLTVATEATSSRDDHKYITTLFWQKFEAPRFLNASQSHDLAKKFFTMPPTDASSLKSGESDTPPLANTGSLEGFIKYLSILASSPDSQFAATVLGEITKQREQIQSQDEELKENKITINGMFKANQDEKSKQQDSASQIESLRATVHKKEIEIAGYSTKLGSLQQEIVNLKATCSQEAAKVSQSVKDITTLQKNSKEKDKTIDQMKTAGSKLKLTLSAEQQKSKELEAANASMRTELQEIRDRIQKMEDFTVQCSDIDDDYV